MRGGYKSALKARLTYDQHRRSEGSYVSFSRFARTYAALGEKDSAVQALEKAFVEREPMAWLNVDPEWTNYSTRDFRTSCAASGYR